MTKKLDKYQGTFNWYGEVHTLWTIAINPNQAYSNMTTRLAKALKLSVRFVRLYYDGSKDNYRIERR